MSATLKTATAARILDAALALFNQRGAAHVTTADIAAAAAMAEGNLHYHFRRKENLVAALFERFQEDELEAAERAIEEPKNRASYIAYSQGWFDLMWRYRCFYRDATTLLTQAPALKPRFVQTQAKARAAVRKVLDLAVTNHLMHATPEQIDRLVTNVWIVSSYWMDYWAIHHTGETLTRDDLAWGFQQITSLYEPYTTLDKSK